MNGSLLLVIPPVLADTGEGILIDEHFSNNLTAYLGAFERVTVVCPSTMTGISHMIPLGQVKDVERCSVIVLPEPYREDRFLRHRGRVKRILSERIDAADYLLIVPHAPFDWSTLATRIAIAKGRDYDMESDWDLQNVTRSQLRELPRGLKRLRRTLWSWSHGKIFLDSMRKSRVALLQGAAVFEAYKAVAPNPRKVLNVQVTPADRIDEAGFQAKLDRVRSGAPLRILYAGRAEPMKGPDDWQKCLDRALAKGLNATATWLGDGQVLESLRQGAAARDIARSVRYPGNVARADTFQELRQAEIFLFCHLTDESPRCLVEALTAATPIVGYASLYACDLVTERGGGEFVPLGDWEELADLLLELDRDRARLADLIVAARAASFLYDRDEAIADRIRLIREHLRPPVRAAAGA